MPSSLGGWLHFNTIILGRTYSTSTRVSFRSLDPLYAVVFPAKSSTTDSRTRTRHGKRHCRAYLVPIVATFNYPDKVLNGSAVAAGHNLGYTVVSGRVP